MHHVPIIRPIAVMLALASLVERLFLLQETLPVSLLYIIMSIHVKVTFVMTCKCWTCIDWHYILYRHALCKVASLMKTSGLKIIRFPKDRCTYVFETQVLALVLFNYAILGFVSYVTILIIDMYSYTWPLWCLIIVVSLALMEATLRIKNTRTIRHLILIISTFLLSPLGLYFSGSITTPSSVYLLVVLVNICILSRGRQRLLYTLSLSLITLSFILIENHYRSLLYFPAPSKEMNLKLWNTIFIAVAWVIYREVSSLTNVLSKYSQRLTRSNIALYEESIVDGLTKVFNKKHLLETLDVALLGLRRKNSSLGILLIDIDDFKAYNDRYGHIEGDVCLKEVALLIQSSLLREGDKAFRFGGEEFVVVLESIDHDGAIVIAKRILDSLRHKKIPFDLSSSDKYVSVSIGVAVFNHLHGHLNREELLKYPDEAMYMAKKNGKNQYKVINTNLDNKGC